MRFFTWGTREGYNCSSSGDRRYSAFAARLEDGLTIEEHYQCNVKGYASVREGKGNPPLKSVTDLYSAYKALWVRYLVMHPKALPILRMKAVEHGYCLCDPYAKTMVNQARALADLLNEQVLEERAQAGLVMKYTYFVEGDPVGPRIFVFGSNLSGAHGLGAAKIAKEHYGAEPGIAEGMMDASYAIPTKDYYTKGQKSIPDLPLEDIEDSVKTFLLEAVRHNGKHDHLEFFITRIGCGLGGYKDSQIAPLFRGAPKNCIFDERWRTYLEDVH